MRWVLVLLLSLVPAIASADFAEDDARLELVLEDRDSPPHAGEMVLLSIRGTFKVPVVREKLRQPALTGFDWMQLGEDRWYKEREDGFEVLKFERRMALFPQKAGESTIEPFVHGLELLNRRNQTIAVEEASNSLALKATPKPGGESWWFPVRRIEIADQWSNQPEALDPGGAALRVISLTVEGTAPQRIPPMPELTGAGAFIFAHPEHRIVSLGPYGPVTRVFWRWTVRPKEESAGYLNPLEMTYFDTEAREQKQITFSAQRVAYVGGPQQVVSEERPPSDTAQTNGLGQSKGFTLPRYFAPVILFLSFGVGLALVLGQWGRSGLQLRKWSYADPDRTALRRSVQRADAKAVWLAARRLLSGGEWPDSLHRLDAALFAGAEIPDLGDVRKDVLAAKRARAK